MDTEVDFVNLLGLLQSSDNDIREEAEKNLNAIPPAQCLSLMIQSIASTQLEMTNRKFAAVLARRLLTTKFDTIGTMDPGEKESLKNQLVLIVHEAREEELCKKVIDICDQWTNPPLMAPKDPAAEWPRLLDLLGQYAQSEDQHYLTLAFYILDRMPDILQFDEHMQPIIELFCKGLTCDNQHVVEASLKAIGSFIEENHDEEQIQSLVQPFLQGVATFMTHNPASEEPLKALVKISDCCSELLKPVLKETMEMSLQILTNEQLDICVRYLALETMVTLSENIPVAVRKTAKQFIPPLIEYLLRMICDLDEDPHWSTQEVPEDDDEGICTNLTSIALDRLACSLNSCLITPKVLSTLSAMLESSDWKQRCGSLHAMAAISEGCRKKMGDMLPTLVRAVCSKLTDPEPRVRYAACKALDEMSQELVPNIQKRHHATILPALSLLISDLCPRVQTMSCSALVAYCTNMPKSILRTYLAQLVELLEAVMKAKMREITPEKGLMVLEEMLSTVTCLAEKMETDFAPYYDRFMPALKVNPPFDSTLQFN
ncbi:Importin-5 [Cichlidogyrus casuarinus]|uniref:Importin-5 n=1 Tax=Cichlidogyrus casuarinus TaxID=1844966 RepID=A0ABD2PQC0_9PLAT